MKRRVTMMGLALLFFLLQIVSVVPVRADSQVQKQEILVVKDRCEVSEGFDDDQNSEVDIMQKGVEANESLSDAACDGTPADTAENVSEGVSESDAESVSESVFESDAENISENVSEKVFESVSEKALSEETGVMTLAAPDTLTGFEWAQNLNRSALPEQGLYVVSVAAEPNRVMTPSGEKYDFGTLIGMPKSSGSMGQVWIIRALPDGSWYIGSSKNSYKVRSAKPALGVNDANGQVMLTAAAQGLNQSEDIKWQIMANADGTYSFKHKKTGKYLDTEYACRGKNPFDLQAQRNSVYQKFYLYSLKSHDIAYTYTDNMTYGAAPDNTLEISNLNDITLSQNLMATAQAQTNITVGSGITVEVKEGFVNKSQWALGSDGATQLPAYYVTMLIASQGSDEEYIRVVYPKAGIWFDGEKSIPVGAVLRFSNIRPADTVFRQFDGFPAKEPGDNYKSLIIGTNLFGGFWYYNIEIMDVSLVLFRCDSGEPIAPVGAYVTFNSLSNTYSTDNNANSRDVGMATCDAYGEFVGIKGKQVMGQVSGSPGDKSSAEADKVTNVRAMDLEMWSPYASASRNYGTYSVFVGQSRLSPNSNTVKQAVWEDRLGGTNFSRNSVSLPLEASETGTTFVMGAFQGGAWNSLSSAPVYANVQPSVKSIVSVGGQRSSHDEDEAYIPLEEGRVTFHLEQEVPQLGFDTTETISKLTVSDTLPEGLAILDVTLLNAENWSYEIVGDRDVVFTYTDNYRERLDLAAEDVRGIFEIQARVTDKAVSDKTVENTAVTTWRTEGHSEESKPSNTVYVTPFDPKLPPNVIHVPDTGGHGSGGYIIVGFGALCLLLSLLRLVNKHGKKQPSSL